MITFLGHLQNTLCYENKTNCYCKLKLMGSVVLVWSWDLFLMKGGTVTMTTFSIMTQEFLLLWMSQITTLIYPESLLSTWGRVTELLSFYLCIFPSIILFRTVSMSWSLLRDFTTSAPFPCEGQEADLLCSPFWKCKWRNNILPLIRLLGLRHCGSHRQSLCCQHYLIADALLGTPSGFETWHNKSSCSIFVLCQIENLE